MTAPSERAYGGWEALCDAHDMWQWDYTGDALLRAVARQCGIQVASVERALARHGGKWDRDARLSDG